MRSSRRDLTSGALRGSQRAPKDASLSVIKYAPVPKTRDFSEPHFCRPKDDLRHGCILGHGFRTPCYDTCYDFRYLVRVFLLGTSFESCQFQGWEGGRGAKTASATQQTHPHSGRHGKLVAAIDTLGCVPRVRGLLKASRVGFSQALRFPSPAGSRVRF